MSYMALPVSFRWDEEFVARVDRARGDVPRSVWVRRAVEQALSGEPNGATPSTERALGALPRARSAAPAEQPKSMFRGPEAELEERLRTAVKHYEPDLRELAAEAPVEKPRLFRCPACDFSAPSPKVTCARHGYRLR